MTGTWSVCCSFPFASSFLIFNFFANDVPINNTINFITVISLHTPYFVHLLQRNLFLNSFYFVYFKLVALLLYYNFLVVSKITTADCATGGWKQSGTTRNVCQHSLFITPKHRTVTIKHLIIVFKTLLTFQ